MSSSKTATKKSNGAAAAKRKPVKAPASQAKVATAKATAAATTTDASVSADMSATAAAMEKALAAGDLASLSAESLQKLMAAAVKAYSAKREAGESFLPLNATAGRVTPTDIMLTSSQLLRAGNLQVFELGMWQSWTGN
jgi:hypothetical protein